jgi:hypothetical protein
MAAEVVLHAFALSLPRGAKVIEIERIPRSVRKDRALVLWMKHPKLHCDKYWRELYACPSLTRGCYRSGPTRVSLVDTATQRVINTIVIRDGNDAPTTVMGHVTGKGHDSLDLPYRNRNGGPYRVVAGERAKILALKDYNGDGDPTEFALFDAGSCSDLLTTLIGYSRRRDRAIHYPIRLRWNDSESTREVTSFWVEHLFNTKPEQPGVWKYVSRYPGATETYEIRYVAADEAFEGTCRVGE